MKGKGTERRKSRGGRVRKRKGRRPSEKELFTFASEAEEGWQP